MDTERLILIHLSDIHFHQRRSGGTYDLDKDLRNELERDAKKMADRLGRVHGILVTGDIAFAGKADEYDKALEWLRLMCGRVGCPEEKVWTTPGNHDVDRAVIMQSVTLQSLHKELRPKDPNGVDEAIRRLMDDPEASSLLYRSLKNYIEFAAKFGCQIGPNSPHWEHDLRLNDGSSLRLRGLNSTLVSDNLDDDAEYRLVLGTMQSLLTREEGVEYVTLCHQPPQWLRDQDMVEKTLNARARIQLFGHKHQQRLDKINDTLRLTAGAVHPDRGEVNWQPRYNWLTMAVSGEGDSRRLEVDVYPRVWTDDEVLFRADYNSEGLDHRSFSLPIGPWSPPEPSPGAIRDIDLVQPSAKNEPGTPETRRADNSGSDAMDPTRRLTYRFLTLPYHERMEIAHSLGLLQDEDKGLQDAELFKRFFRRAREREKLGQLWNEIEGRHHDGKHADNPFANR
jgi:predicted phosphodiesterase